MLVYIDDNQLLSNEYFRLKSKVNEIHVSLVVQIQIKYHLIRIYKRYASFKKNSPFN